jgi:hypothetical protein
MRVSAASNKLCRVSCRVKPPPCRVKPRHCRVTRASHRVKLHSCCVTSSTSVNRWVLAGDYADYGAFTWSYIALYHFILQCDENLSYILRYITIYDDIFFSQVLWWPASSASNELTPIVPSAQIEGALRAPSGEENECCSFVTGSQGGLRPPLASWPQAAS